MIQMARRLGMLLPTLSLVFILILGAYPAFAETLVAFEDGKQMTSESLLTQGKVLIYIERDCAACEKYVRGLKNCSEDLHARIQLISVSTPAQTKEMHKKIPMGWSVLVLKSQSAAKSVFATPTTKFGVRQKVGILNCQELESWLR